MHGAYLSLLQLGEDMQLLHIDVGFAHRYALLNHVGKLFIECGIASEDLKHLAGMNEERIGREFSDKSSQRNRNAIVTSTPCLCHSTSDELPVESTGCTGREATFEAVSDFRGGIPWSPSTSPPRIASAPHLCTTPSFSNNPEGTVPATYSTWPRSLTSQHSLCLDINSGRKTISHPLPLQPLSPGDFDIPKVHSYPKPGLCQKLRTMASRISLSSFIQAPNSSR